ncbi:MAG: hypothetical protein HOO96_25555 [Polyangiaceae bacterium]|nr:hypothetical protein [Polyangiaceae bacterium]
MRSTARRTAPLEEKDPVATALAAAVEAHAMYLRALANASRGPEFVPASATGIARPQLRRWELAGTVRVLRAGREKLYNIQDIAALGERASELAPKPELAKTTDPTVALAAIAASVRQGGRR